MFKILIVDDEPDMCKGLADVIEEEGFKPLIANNGETALEKVREEQPDLVLLDVRLPGMDGVQVLKKIKEINRFLPVVMVTGYGNIESAVDVIKAGALEYITKPFDNNKIISIINRVLQSSSPVRPRGVMHEELMNKLKVDRFKEHDAVPAGKAVHNGGRVIAIKRLHVLAGLIILLLSLAVFQGLKRDIAYQSSSQNPSEVMWDGKNIWSSDWLSQDIYKHNMDRALSVAQTYHFKDIHPTALCPVADYIWVCGTWERRIFVLDPDKGFRVITSYKTPSTSPSGLCWDGKNLWTCDADSRKIYKHDSDYELSVIETFDSPATNPSGLAWDGRNLWSCDADTSRIYKHNMDSTLSVAVVYEPLVYSLNEGKLTGLTWDGKHMWTSDEKQKNIYRHNLSWMKLRLSLKSILKPVKKEI